MSEIPRVNWPEERGSYKFVQLDLDGKPYLRFRKVEMGCYHAAILSDFLRQQNADYKLNELMIPAIEGQRYAVRGMGVALVNINGSERSVHFSGRSTDYEIGPNKEHLETIAKEEPDWNFNYC